MRAAVDSPGRAVSIGIDVVSVDTVARWLTRYDDDTLRMIFPQEEIDACRASDHPHHGFAICFAAKEAVGKALGRGLAGMMWNEVRTAPDEAWLEVSLRGAARESALACGITGWSARTMRLRKDVVVVVLGESGGTT
jgi:holo-[acyl-carrier protein] synthase